MKTYNKLVRDRIPEIIEQSGRKCEVVVMEEAQYEAALREKLVEEAAEAKAAERSELLKELADIQEVVWSLMDLHGISGEELEAEKARRRTERGGFERRLELVWTE